LSIAFSTGAVFAVTSFSVRLSFDEKVLANTMVVIAKLTKLVVIALGQHI
jgi:hypothetical protein